MAKLTILHIPTWYPNQDDVQLGVFIENQIELLSEDCHHIVFHLQSRKESKKIESTVSTLNNITKIHVTYPSGKNIFSKTRNFLNSVTNGLSKLIGLNQKIDLVHCHVASKNLWIAQKYFEDTPCLLSEHWSGFVNGNFDNQNSWKKKLMVKRMNKCDKIIAVSPHLKSALIQYNVTTEIEVIGNLILQPSPKLNLNKKLNKILIVSDLCDDIKNISGTIHAIKKVVPEFPDLTLTIIGDGPDKEKIIELINELALSENIFLKGRLSQENVLAEYANYDVLIVNSFIETFSMVTLEALSAGIPVIASKCKGPEQFITEENGLLVSINNHEALAEAILNLIQHYSNYQPNKIRASVQHFIAPEKIKKAILTNYFTLTN
jgi:glycosyltransferase involved in cell wall biosynthesis